VLTATESKFSLHGSGGKTRTLAEPVMPATVALTEPDWASESEAATNSPLVTVPFN